MERQQSIIETMTSLVKLMVDEPELVQVYVPASSDGMTLRVTVAPRDKGKLIGKQGRTARSLRIVLASIGMASQERISLDIDG